MKWLIPLKELLKQRLTKKNVLKEALYLEQVLMTLCHQQCAINIQFYRCRTPFISTVLYVDPAHAFILIDEINHDEGNKLALGAEPFVIKAQCGEDLVVFEGQVERIHTLRGIPCYRLAYPKTIAHCKRRNCPRYAMPDNTKVDLFITHLPRFKAMVKDISMVGISIAVPKHLRNILQSLLAKEECRLIFSHDLTLSFTFTLKHYRHDFANQQLILGCQFHHLDNTRLKVLATMINQA